ncbi:MAG: ribonuclease P protein component [Candidatus Eiseniibacteriota bacterium]
MERRTDPPGPPGGPGLGTRFGRSNRLARTWEYQRAYREGRHRRGNHAVAYMLAVPGEPSRAGVVASRKVGSAVVRNRAKRRLRSIIRGLWPGVPPTGASLVLIALPTAATIDFEELTDDVAELWRQLGVLQR